MFNEDMDADDEDENSGEEPVPEEEAMVVFYDPEIGELTRVELSPGFENENALLKADIFKDCRDHFEEEREESFVKWFEICKKTDENGEKTDPNGNGKGA